MIFSFSCLTQLSMQFIILISVKMPTIVGILTFISMIKTTSRSLKAIKILYFQHFYFTSILNFMLSWVVHELFFITLGPDYVILVLTHLVFCFVALRPKSTALVIVGLSVHLTVLLPGHDWTRAQYTQTGNSHTGKCIYWNQDVEAELLKLVYMLKIK